MSLFIALILGGILVYYVLKPILNNNEAAFSPVYNGNKKSDDLLRDKNELLQEIKEIDFEYNMGKLSEEDYTELKNDYENKAINVLQKLEDKGNGKSRKHNLEEEIEMHRKKYANRRSKINFCPSCGAKISPNSKFCGSCGTKIN